MRKSNTLKWIITASMSVGLAAAVPAIAKDPPKGEQDKELRYAELPEAVKKTVNEQRGKHELKMIQFVERGERKFYRVTINEKGNDKVIRVDEGGKLIDEKEVKDRGPERQGKGK